MTSGENREDPILVSDELKRRGINVIAVGVGPAVKESELSGIASRPDLVYSVENFDDLVKSEFTSSITSATCDTGKVMRWVWMLIWTFLFVSQNTRI